MFKVSSMCVESDTGQNGNKSKTATNQNRDIQNSNNQNSDMLKQRQTKTGKNQNRWVLGILTCWRHTKQSVFAFR